MADSSYIPGMCNINTAEIAYRRKAMWFGIIASVVILIALLALDMPWWIVAVLLFTPTYIAAIGFLQVRNRFCVAYGASGKQNADESSSYAQTVTDKKALAADTAKTRAMKTQAFLITITALVILSAVLYFFA